MSGGPQEPYRPPGVGGPYYDPDATAAPQRGWSSQVPGGLLRRLGARVIDSLLVGLVGAVLGAGLDFSYVWVVIQALLTFAYFVLLDAYAGTTGGKRLLGMRVTGPTGGNPTLGQAAVREAFTVVGAIPFAGPVLSLIAWVVIGVTINSSPTKQGKHDELAGGTRVIRA